MDTDGSRPASSGRRDQCCSSETSVQTDYTVAQPGTEQYQYLLPDILIYKFLKRVCSLYCIVFSVVEMRLMSEIPWKVGVRWFNLITDIRDSPVQADNNDNPQSAYRITGSTFLTVEPGSR
jgi:hypothetical protein